jgi:formate hydrogenlyase transcriptional activator
VFVATSVNIRSDELDMVEQKFEQIIGSSPTLKVALAEVERVAPTDSTVLVLGETGTGKELIARAIHNLSARGGRPFVKLNCAAIPFDLLESELFGHEKGAFTGAVAQKIGRFEMAETGTIFLDEIGDLPLALQPKLLRVLQEHEFERLGGGRTVQIDVRVVSATNQDLWRMVQERKFRADLYYRLNVFPITLPPLRGRAEDIPALVTYFVDFYGRRIGKHIEHIPEETMSALRSYAWPGNVRELQNLIERAVILSHDGVLPNPLPSNCQETVTVISKSTTLKDVDRALILQELEGAGWIIGGPEGAAAKLGLKRTTLIYKMKRFGILRPLRGRRVRGSFRNTLQHSVIDDNVVSTTHKLAPRSRVSSHNCRCTRCAASPEAASLLNSIRTGLFSSFALARHAHRQSAFCPDVRDLTPSRVPRHSPFHKSSEFKHVL